jgi:hypothetical protein
MALSQLLYEPGIRSIKEMRRSDLTVIEDRDSLFMVYWQTLSDGRDRYPDPLNRLSE